MENAMNFNYQTQKLVSQIVGPDGTLINEIVERESPIEIPDHHAIHDERWVYVRKERDRLLAESDWRVTKAAETGIPMAQEWIDYRQALRDITNQKNPFLIEWPTPPATTAATNDVVYQVGSM